MDQNQRDNVIKLASSLAQENVAAIKQKRRAQLKKRALFGCGIFCLVSIAGATGWFFNQQPMQSHVAEATQAQSNKTNPIRMWSELTDKEKDKYVIEAIALFPEIVGRDYRTKYKRLNIWTLQEQKIHLSTTRNIFTSGGQEDIILNEKTYERMSQIFVKLYANKAAIVNLITNMQSRELAKYWGVYPPDDYAGRAQIWIEKASHDLEPSEVELIHTIMLGEDS